MKAKQARRLGGAEALERLAAVTSGQKGRKLARLAEKLKRRELERQSRPSARRKAGAKLFTMMMTVDMREALREAAWERRVSMSQVVRDALDGRDACSEPTSFRADKGKKVQASFFLPAEEREGLNGAGISAAAVVRRAIRDWLRRAGE